MVQSWGEERVRMDFSSTIAYTTIFSSIVSAKAVRRNSTA